MSAITMDAVRDLIERHSAWVIGNNRCFHNGAYAEIADELNATLGESKRAVCSECGTLLSDYILCTPCAEKLAVKRDG